MFWRRGTSSSRKKPKPPGRKRIAAGWVLLVVGVLITGVWGASRWWLFGVMSGHVQIAALNGLLVVGWFPQPQDRLPSQWIGRTQEAKDRRLHWRVQHPARYPPPTMEGWDTWVMAYSEMIQEKGGGYSFQMYWLCLWPFALIPLLGGGWLLWAGRRVKRRAAMGWCRTCGYDLAGLEAAAVCPECGKEQARGEAASRRTV